MSVKQFSVFIENAPGSLAAFAGLMSENGIDLVSLSMADTTHFGILRAIAGDNEAAVRVLARSGYTVKLTDVLGVSVPDTPGALSRALDVLAEGNISVEYLYSCVHGAAGQAWIIIRADDPVRGEALLKEAGVVLLTEEEIRGKK